MGLDMGGHLISIKNVLTSTPLHVNSAISPPNQTIQEIERILTKFLQGQDEQEDKRHWISWSRLYHPLKNNGLRLTSLQHVITVFSYKPWCLYLSNDPIWARFMCSRYGDFTYIRTYGVSLSLASHTWCRIVDIWEEAKMHIVLLIRDGNSTFWLDHWTQEGCLITSALSNLSQSTQNLCIKDVVDSSWLELLSYSLFGD